MRSQGYIGGSYRRLRLLSLVIAFVAASCTSAAGGSDGLPSELSWIESSSEVGGPLGIPDQIDAFIRMTVGDPIEAACDGTVALEASGSSAEVALTGTYYRANTPEYPSRHVFVLGDGRDLIVVADFQRIGATGRVEVSRLEGFIVGGSSLKALDATLLEDSSDFTISGALDGTGEFAGTSGTMDLVVSCGDRSGA